MMKAKERVYRGIEFINVGELPADQQLLLEHASRPERIKILIDGKVLGNCIQYGKYSDWYNAVYKQSVTPAVLKPVQEKVFLPLEISLTKV
jgi:hypothetical protein